MGKKLELLVSFQSFTYFFLSDKQPHIFRIQNRYVQIKHNNIFLKDELKKIHREIEESFFFFPNICVRDKTIYKNPSIFRQSTTQEKKGNHRRKITSKSVHFIHFV